MKLWFQRGFFTYDNPPMKAENEDTWLKLTERVIPAPFAIPTGATTAVSLAPKPVVTAPVLPMPPMIEEPQWYYIDKQGKVGVAFPSLAIAMSCHLILCQY
jgi:hypothetical protein